MPAQHSLRPRCAGTSSPGSRCAQKQPCDQPLLGAWHHRAGKQFAHRHPKHEGRIIPAAETLIAGRLALLTSLRSVSMPVSSNSISIPRSDTASSIARCPRPAGKSACCPRGGCERYDAPGNAGNAPHSAAPCDDGPRCDRSWPSRSLSIVTLASRCRCNDGAWSCRHTLPARHLHICDNG